MSGSSVRKLKKSHANLLAGRALSKKMFPLSMLEVESDFDLELALAYGQIPMCVTAASVVEKVELCRNVSERGDSAGGFSQESR